MNPATFIRLALWGRNAVETTVTTLRIFRIRKAEMIRNPGNENAANTIYYPRYFNAEGKVCLSEKQVTRILLWGGISSVVLGFVSYEYFKHISLVPITNRRHCVFLTKKQELSYQAYALERANYHQKRKVCHTVCEKKNESDKECEMKEICEVRDEIGYKRIITNPRDKRVVMVNRIVRRLREACNYFEPGNEDYYDHMKVFVVESPRVNAYAALGGYVVVYTGLIDHYQSHLEAGRCESVEDAVAGVLAHEFSHTLAQHNTERVFHISHLFFYIAMALSGDVILLSGIKRLFDDNKSCSMEYEADLMALYLMKRANYNMQTWSTTLDLLRTDKEGYRIQENTKSNDHPVIYARMKAVKRHLSVVEKAFEEKYEVAEESTYQKIADYVNSWISVLFT